MSLLMSINKDEKCSNRDFIGKDTSFVFLLYRFCWCECNNLNLKKIVGHQISMLI